MRKTVVFTILLALLLGVAGMVVAETPQEGGTLRVGVHRDPNGFDPHVTYGASNHWCQGSIYDTLIEYNTDGEFVGALAKSWEIVGEDTFIFYLREDVQFHNGEPFDAKDVIATFDRIADPETNATQKPVVDRMESYKALDDFTVEVVLRETDITFLHALASHTMYIVSEKDVRNEMDFHMEFNGTGPFILDSWEPDAYYTFVQNPNFWKEGLPYLDQMVFNPIVEDRTRMNALRSGEVDLVEYVPWQEITGLDLYYNIYMTYDLFNLVRLNNNVYPLDNKLVRQALNYIIDRQAVINLAFGSLGEAKDGPLQPKGSAFYFEELEGHFATNHEKALELLEEAGYPNLEDFPTLEFTVSPLPVHTGTAEVVQQQLNEFGIDTRWKTVEVAEFVQNRVNGTYTMQMDGLSMAWPDPDYLRFLFHSEGTGHATGVGFENEEIDFYLEEGRRTIDQEERQNLYLEAEKLILDEAPWLFILWRPQAEAANEKVGGYTVIPGGLGAFNMNRFEYIWRSE